MFKQKTKKNIAVALAFIFAASNLWAAFPQKAFGVPVLIVGDTSPTGILNAANLGVIAGATSATAVNTTITVNKESWLDSLGWMMANVVIDQFGDAIVDWIRNGFEGSPMFLSDPEGFFRETANQASGAIISKFNAEWLCSPLGKLKIDLNFLFPGTDRVKYGCTFNDITGNFRDIAGRTDLDDWVDFNVDVGEDNIVKNFSSDYRNGGFLMWLTTADWKNNDVGATLRVVDDAFIAASAKISLGAFQLDLGQGFFGVKKCLAYDAQKNCVKEITTSPGQLVQDQLKLVAGKDLSRLEVADEINEIIGALATTMMGWLLTGGNEGEGVMGYDINAYYSGTNRDHFGTLSRSQQINQTKFDLAAQIQDIENNEKQFSNYLENYAGDLYGAKEKLEIVLAKLKCIKATSTKIVYDDTDCDNMDESIKKITVSGDKHGTSTIDKTLDDITSDITKTEDQINSVNGKISIFFGQYGEKATSTSVQALKLFDEFESGVMFATSLAKITDLVDEYCYSYNGEGKAGKICGLFGDKSAGDSMVIYISSEKNPATKDIADDIKTKINWKAINAESCLPFGGDSDVTWKATTISISGSYTTTNFKDGESRKYGVKCADAKSVYSTAEVTVSADSSIAADMTGLLFAKSLFVKSGESSILYWLTTNASQCYLYSEKDSFSGDVKHVTSSSEGWFIGAGYYLETYLAKTTGQFTAALEEGDIFQDKLICGDSSDVYRVLSELEIATEDDNQEIYKTHDQRENKILSKETGKIEIEMEQTELEFACLLNEYTQVEGVSQLECSVFEESSSSASSP